MSLGTRCTSQSPDVTSLWGPWSFPVLWKSLPFITLYASDSCPRQDKSFCAEAGRILFIAFGTSGLFLLSPQRLLSVCAGSSKFILKCLPTADKAKSLIGNSPGPRERTTPQSKQQGSWLTRCLVIGGTRKGQEDAGHPSRGEGWRTSNYPEVYLLPFYGIKINLTSWWQFSAQHTKLSLA